MRNKKILIACSLFILLCIVCIFNAFAHSGRTDSSGGHWNRSTGTYHYHCGGYPAHSHSGGVCPYKKKKTADDIIKEFNSIGKTSSSSTSSYDKGYKAGLLDGRKENYEHYSDGYDTGYDSGYEDGYEDGIEKAVKVTAIILIPILALIIIIAIVKFIKKRRNKKLNDNFKSVNKILEEESDNTRTKQQYHQLTFFDGSDADKT